MIEENEKENLKMSVDTQRYMNYIKIMKKMKKSQTVTNVLLTIITIILVVCFIVTMGIIASIGAMTKI